MWIMPHLSCFPWNMLFYMGSGYSGIGIGDHHFIPT